MSSVASYIRSGFPVIILGDLIVNDQKLGLHAVCCVGFRNLSNPVPIESIILEDSLNEILYIHDDNLGPNTRFKIAVKKVEKGKKVEEKYAILQLEAPDYSQYKKK